MITIGMKMLGVLLLVLFAASPLGCGGHEDNRPNSGVTIGGHNGVVAGRSESGSGVKIGGDHGLVIGHPQD